MRSQLTKSLGWPSEIIMQYVGGKIICKALGIPAFWSSHCYHCRTFWRPMHPPFSIAGCIPNNPSSTLINYYTLSHFLFHSLCCPKREIYIHFLNKLKKYEMLKSTYIFKINWKSMRCWNPLSLITVVAINFLGINPPELTSNGENLPWKFCKKYRLQNIYYYKFGCI